MQDNSLFAEIIVDIQAPDLGDRLFTYAVPEALKGEILTGTQVLVPFGKQELVAGYVVALKDTCPEGIEIKEILEVLDSEPLFDKDYIDFLYWVADYYCAGIAQVVAAAIPADSAPRLKRTARLVCRHDSGDLELPGEIGDGAAYAVFDALAQSKSGSLALRALRQRTRLGASRFYRALVGLRQSGIVEVVVETEGKVAPKVVNRVMWTGQEPSSKRQAEVVATLRRHGNSMDIASLMKAAGTSRETVYRMCRDGVLDYGQAEVLRDPLKEVDAVTGSVPPPLTPDQARALGTLMSQLRSSLSASSKAVNGSVSTQFSSLGGLGAPAASRLQCRPEELAGSALAMQPPPVATAQCDATLDDLASVVHPWLLWGVTGSGKTEIYLRLIRECLDRGRTAMLLVPEISLTPQLAQRLKARFDRHVAVWHSALSPGERYDTWRRLNAGDVRVLLGARSAILANMPSLGLIILDEEHDSSYKQSTPSPRYNAKRLALERARRHGAFVLFGSATPDVATFHDARQSGRMVELPNRVFQQAMPDVVLVDMRKEFAAGNKSIFSGRLRQELDACLERKEQAILLMNRRGYASHVFCRACGFVIKCRNCSVSMVLHQTASDRSGYLACHHCGHTRSAQSECPSCQSPFLREYGLGTQRVEHELKSLLPGARLLRLDSDVTARRGAFQQILSDFARGNADVLIGTQMVAKGLDIPAVTLVGVLSADAVFNLPDYRSVERGFQLLTQVSGRAGRGDAPGVVIMQSYNLEMPALSWARNHDYDSFVQAETRARMELSYPPFSQLIRVVMAGGAALEVQGALEQLAEHLTAFLEDHDSNADITILGPASCLIERIRGQFRFHLLIKNRAGDAGRALVTSFLRSWQVRSGLHLAVDVDALDTV